MAQAAENKREQNCKQEKIAYMRGDAAASQMLLINQLLHNDLLLAKRKFTKSCSRF